MESAAEIVADAFLGGALTLQLVVRACRGSSRPLTAPPSRLQFAAVAFNAFLGLLYTGVAALSTPAPPPAILSRGVLHLLVGAAFALRLAVLGTAFARRWSAAFAAVTVLAASASAFRALSPSSPFPSPDLYLTPLSVPAAALLLLHAYKHEKLAVDVSGGNNASPLAAAGAASKLFFCWLNPLMSTGSKKTLEEKDIPALADADCAGTRYRLFQNAQSSPASASLLSGIVSCHSTDIAVSGIFALLKILSVSAGPLLLKAFIRVAESGAAAGYDGYALAAAMLAVKVIESTSQRQWYFRTRRLGVNVRSLLMACVAKKQLRLPPATHSGRIMSSVAVDADRVGELPFWCHQTWTTSLQLCIALTILYSAVGGAATLSAMSVICVTVACNGPLAKLQHEFQTKLMASADDRVKAMGEAVLAMKVLKLYAWDAHFRRAVEALRDGELRWLKAFLLRKAYNSVLFWSSPVLVSAAAFAACYFADVKLTASNVFTFVATLRLVQEPVRQIPDVVGAVIQARVAFDRIKCFLDEPELGGACRRSFAAGDAAVRMDSCSFSWDEGAGKATLRNVSLVVGAGKKVAVCGEVGAGKSTLLAAVLGEVPKIAGEVYVCGSIAYVSQSAWIQTGTLQDNILFGSPMERQRYHRTLERCSLIKDLDTLPFGDLTQIGERGINLSGGQKQRVQLARALYKDADIYLLDDPFSAVDAHTATSLFNDYILDGLSDKIVILVTHQVDFLPMFDSILFMSEGEICTVGQYNDLLTSCKEFANLVNAHKDSVGLSGINTTVHHRWDEISSLHPERIRHNTPMEIKKPLGTDQMIRKEEREMGDTGLKPYKLYLGQNKGYFFALIAAICNLVFLSGQISQNSWMAKNVQNPDLSILKLIVVYIVIGLCSLIFLIARSLSLVALGASASRSLFSQLADSLFRAPMSFFDSTPVGRILSRVSSDLSIIDLDLPFSLVLSICATENYYANVGVLSVVTWEVLFIAVPMILLSMRLQKYYFATAKELMRINGTTKSLVANHLAESISGAATIRAFQEEERFFQQSLDLIDRNASSFFYNFVATEWLIQRLELMSAVILFASALTIASLPPDAITPGLIGMALSYGLSMNNTFVNSIQQQCNLAKLIISVERLNQYMHITSEAPEVIEENRPAQDWPSVGKVEMKDLKIRYRIDSPFVLHGITCTFEGGHKIGIVGRTGSGKTTLISALFRLVEPSEGRIVVDNVDIVTIGLHDLRSRFAVIPQDPTLFHGTIRYNLDPLEQFTDQQIWEVLDKCQLREAVEEKEKGLDSLVVEEGSNWSMGQRQLFCLGRALLRRSRILVLDEATASIDNATDAILQRTIRTEFRDATVITVAHRIPSVMDCTMVLALSDGRIVEYDDPQQLMNTEGSLFRELVKEYWSHNSDGGLR